MTQAPRYLSLLVLAALAGCQAYSPFPPVPAPEPPGAGLAGYAAGLAAQDRPGLAGALAEAKAERRDAGDPESLARLGLARGQPGHEGYDPEAAAEDLSAALSNESADWPAYDRAFLSLRVAQLERAVERQRTHAELVRENRRLRRALDEAERKLRALSEIEEQIGP